MKHSFIAALSAAILLSSCASQRAVEKVRYFQDLEDGASYATRVEQAITVKPEDKLTIVVNSKDPELAGIYNLPVISRYLGSEGSNFSQNQSVASYTVDRRATLTSRYWEASRLREGPGARLPKRSRASSWTAISSGTLWSQSSS